MFPPLIPWLSCFTSTSTELVRTLPRTGRELDSVESMELCSYVYTWWGRRPCDRYAEDAVMLLWLCLVAVPFCQ